jgi:uncharacterized metal-binding protein
MMSSVGTLTAVASMEAMRRVNPSQAGLFCTAALAVDIPKHRKTTEAAARILAIDGCANRCASKVVERSGAGAGHFRELNLLKDLGIPKRGPFKPFDYTDSELTKAVGAIVAICEDSA